jgi:hypothetical protein
VPHVPPDFLSSFLALVNFMRLSLLKAAYAVVGWSHVTGNPVASAYVGRIRRAKPTRDSCETRSARQSSRNLSFSAALFHRGAHSVRKVRRFCGLSLSVINLHQQGCYRKIQRILRQRILQVADGSV